MELRKLRQGQTIYMVNPDWGYVLEAFVLSKVKEELGGSTLTVHERVIFDAHKPVDNMLDDVEVSYFFPKDETIVLGVTRSRGKAIRWAKEGLKASLASGRIAITESGSLAKVMTPNPDEVGIDEYIVSLDEDSQKRIKTLIDRDEVGISEIPE